MQYVYGVMTNNQYITIIVKCKMDNLTTEYFSHFL
jgi:hypothetical protein